MVDKQGQTKKKRTAYYYVRRKIIAI